MDKCIVQRPRQFDLAVKSLYSQSLFSISNEDINLTGSSAPISTPPARTPFGLQYSVRGSPMWSSSSSTMPPDVGFRGRGRPAFIPQEILDQPLRRPGCPPPLAAPVQTKPLLEEFPQFTEFFTGKLVDNLVIYRTMETYIFQDGRSLFDFQRMMRRLSVLALDCHRNVATICKYLYVFSQDPKVGPNLRAAFFGNLEEDFTNREELKKREGPTRYRNFIRWIMAAAHHYRNLAFAPFDDLMLSLLELADEISAFNDTEDIPLYVMLILRFYYYTSLPCFDGSDVSAKLGAEHMAAISKARALVRQRLTRGGWSALQMGWFTLLLEVLRSSPTIDPDIREYYENILPGFSLLLPSALMIKLPVGHGRSKYLERISQFIE